MKDDDLIDVLEDAGLSPYQAEAYVTLLELGSASATDIADACDVPDPRIYDVLRDLESKGYIETYQQDSLTARAHDPETVLDDLRSRSSEYLSAAEEIEDRWNQPAVAEHEVSIVKRFETVMNRAREIIDNAEKQIQIAVDVDQFHSLKDALGDARDRGVHVKLSLCTREGDRLPSEEALASVCTEARHRDTPSPFLVLVDRRWTCFAPHSQSVNEYGVLVSDRTHTYVFHWFFLTCLWEIWDTIYTLRTPETPTTYVDLRHCVRDVDPLLDEGATIVATVEGYETDTHETVTLHGRITRVRYTGETAGRDQQLPLSQLAGRVSITLETDDGPVEVGGWGAVIEEVEASEITIEDVRYD
ncbi:MULTISPECIES: TrmB family transcriptional regulator [Halomicrobium]|uniref:Transcriptional regulator, TrmB n=2 Tax=Halomicrobium mukohataei TaxID=57705 RepID=C7NXE1_HALMD|nr:MULTISPECIES: TrmB family transcriptional regulator sugar-binding domain-containing protein [Halomicrobium]ACV48375.1 transcriptional regulator, TrmB [Halomicrobium mukohataei DSM 12286]QCD66786.1 TrmB family transcriptional regulator [Halomicrobium mukohataei]QFR21595.1 TrmB family transcriptional regulator [Halomicrobium sp. ZPS1]